MKIIEIIFNILKNFDFFKNMDDKKKGLLFLSFLLTSCFFYFYEFKNTVFKNFELIDFKFIELKKKVDDINLKLLFEELFEVEMMINELKNKNQLTDEEKRRLIIYYARREKIKAEINSLMKN